LRRQSDFASELEKLFLRELISRFAASALQLGGACENALEAQAVECTRWRFG
jgi:hypothetical protein